MAATGKKKKARILVVDDDEGVRELMATTLTAAGYAVVQASGGEEALELIRTKTFDVVLLDIMMPDLDGYEVLSRLRSMPKRAHTPVIVVTAKGQEQRGMLQEANVGADDHLDKPFRPATLEQAVEAVLAKSTDELLKQRTMSLRAAGMYEAIISLREHPEEEEERPSSRLRRRK